MFRVHFEHRELQVKRQRISSFGVNNVYSNIWYRKAPYRALTL